jgi:hypothetical protein
VDKVNAELVTLTYGTIVAQLCNDLDYNYVAVNSELEKMGYNIGMRLIEDFLARSGTGRCGSFRDTAEVISKVRRALARIEDATLTKSLKLLGWVQNVLERHAHRR